MSEIKDGGPAFPSHGSMGEVVCEGMTLRDYFAGQALVGFMVGTNEPAKVAYEIADAMLAAREVKS